MYAVVGCGDCEALWIVEGRPESSQCPRCGTTRQHAHRTKFVRTDDPDRAREARAAMLADRQGYGDAFDELGSFAELGAVADDAGPSDETYLAGAGLDPETIAGAGDRAGPGAGGERPSQEGILRAALRELDSPTEADVVAYAAERGVPEARCRDRLEKLVQTGDVSRSQGTYRLV